MLASITPIQWTLIALGAMFFGMNKTGVQGIGMLAIPIFAAGILGYAALHATVDYTIQIPGIALYFAALLGVGCAAAMLERVPDGPGG